MITQDPAVMSTYRAVCDAHTRFMEAGSLLRALNADYINNRISRPEYEAGCLRYEQVLFDYGTTSKAYDAACADYFRKELGNG